MASSVPIVDVSISGISGISDGSVTESMLQHMEEADHQAEALIAANQTAMEALAAQHEAPLRNKERTARTVRRARTNSSRSRSLHSSRAEEDQDEART